MNALFKEYDSAKVKQYYAENYIQHNPHVPTGRQAILNLVPALQEAGISFQNYRILQDKDMVIMHDIYQNMDEFDTKQTITFDVFRVENGQIAEYWDCIQAFDPNAKNKSERTAIDGSTEIKDLDKTEENKKLVEDFYQKVFVEGKKEETDNYISQETYIQHSTAGKDGIESLKKFLNFYITDNYNPAKIHQVFGEGNFVLVQAESVEEGKPTAFYDLFVVENGKITEHWDILQEIPADMAHENGMF